ncbi:uncharacterized protein LOC131252175 [Magnolia sinica]|uniref:uncharacterized protein LOC131252175 n=1 Tax=Magnolia sinica TaxID=86752 RepID=UPI00265AB9D4|nr:uncharacterized protein LOC131252175 [Magnolia sinica]
MGGRPSSTKRLLAIAVAIIAVISPLYIDWEPSDEPEPCEGTSVPVAWLPLLLITLIMAINLSRFLDRRYARLDPYWIHRVGGSSCGIAALLMVLALVLKCKASMRE